MSDALPGADPAQDRWTLSWKEAAAAQETGWGSLSESLEDVRAGLCRGKGGSKESERCVPRVRKPARAGQVINAQQKLCGRESIYSCNGLSLNTAAAQRGADALGCARAWAPCSGGPAGGSGTTPPGQPQAAPSRGACCVGGSRVHLCCPGQEPVAPGRELVPLDFTFYVIVNTFKFQ